MKYRWVIYTEGPPVMADFLTTFGQGAQLTPRAKSTTSTVKLRTELASDRRAISEGII